jgi:rhomboid protease GluP
MSIRFPLKINRPPLAVPKTGRWVLIALIAAPVLMELLLQGADAGLWGSPRWRNLCYQFGGFWAGLLSDWTPNFTAQPVTMFFSYAFLHAGLNHVLGNMVGLFVLGPLVSARHGGRGLAVIYALCAVGGALVFGVISQSAAPMVGASGAVFGLAGVCSVWDWHTARTKGATRLRQAQPILIAVGLVAMNGVLWLANGGALAWEAHLGGYLTGALLAIFVFKA